jgi:hypothetical protein
VLIKWRAFSKRNEVRPRARAAGAAAAGGGGGTGGGASARTKTLIVPARNYSLHY